MSEIAPRFDYGQLSPKVSARVAEAADKIRTHGRAAAQSVAEIGKELLAVQKVLTDDRRFLAWIDAEFGWSKSTAYNYMNLAREFPTVGNSLPHTDLRTLYLLAAPSTPDWVRTAAHELAGNGEAFSYSDVREMLGGLCPDTNAHPNGHAAAIGREKTPRSASRTPPPVPEPFDGPDRENALKLHDWLIHGRRIAATFKSGQVAALRCQENRVVLDPDRIDVLMEFLSALYHTLATEPGSGAQP